MFVSVDCSHPHPPPPVPCVALRVFVHMQDDSAAAEAEEEEEGAAAPSTPAADDDAATKRKPCTKLVCVSKEAAARGGGGGGGGHAATEAPIKGYGILQRHAYALVDLKEVSGYRLVRIRNPWGHGEWSGPWSDNVSGG
jgi:hypothetical protein